MGREDESGSGLDIFRRYLQDTNGTKSKSQQNAFSGDPLVALEREGHRHAADSEVEDEEKEHVLYHNPNLLC